MAIDAFERAVVADALGHDRVRHLGLLVLDDVQHAVEALAAHVADALVLVLELVQLALGDGPEPLGALGELVAHDDVELLQGDGRGQRVARSRCRPMAGRRCRASARRSAGVVMVPQMARPAESPLPQVTMSGVTP